VGEDSHIKVTGMLAISRKPKLQVLVSLIFWGRACEAHALPSQHTTHSTHREHESLYAVVLQPRLICCLVIFPGKINAKLTEALDCNIIPHSIPSFLITVKPPWMSSSQLQGE